MIAYHQFQEWIQVAMMSDGYYFILVKTLGYERVEVTFGETKAPGASIPLLPPRLNICMSSMFP